jgi:glycine cleavage system transcriptional repressor
MIRGYRRRLMPVFALSAVGRDRPGIVAAVSEVLLRHGANVEDSQMTILRGHFTMMLVVAAPGGADERALREELEAAGERLGLEAVLLSAIEALDSLAEPQPTRIVTVYGADHPGILHAVTSAIAGLGADVTDLNTRLVGEDGEPVYALLMEVAPAPGSNPADIDRALEAVAREQSVDVSVRPLEHEAL